MNRNIYASAVGCGLQLLSIIAVLCLSVAAQNTSSPSSEQAAIHGTVQDSAAKPVANVLVKLKQENAPIEQQTKTDADGVFAFSGLRPGNYLVSAEGPSEHSQARTVTVVSGDNKRIDLTIVAGSATPDANAMQFADQPNFTVAGVTDWTAAGGHGSDSTLRTSEALARETITLKPNHKEAGAAGSTAASQAGQYRLAGNHAEQAGDPLTAVHEYEQAARLDPSEENYFAWGSELLLHRAVWQAQQVFDEGVIAYPRSARMLMALGAALFAGDAYDQAATRICEASDLDPADQVAYISLGKIEMEAPAPLSCVDSKLERFARERPDEALANYYYAMALLKRVGPTATPEQTRPAEALLLKAIKIDSKCGDADLQLGILAFARRDYDAAIGYYQKAIEGKPRLGEAHYRLGVAYDRTGRHDEAKRELAIHDEIEKEDAAEVERQRREVKQFLIVLNGNPASAPTH